MMIARWSPWPSRRGRNRAPVHSISCVAKASSIFSDPQQKVAGPETPVRSSTRSTILSFVLRAVPRWCFVRSSFPSTKKMRRSPFSLHLSMAFSKCVLKITRAHCRFPRSLKYCLCWLYAARRCVGPERHGWYAVIISVVCRFCPTSFIQHQRPSPIGSFPVSSTCS